MPIRLNAKLAAAYVKSAEYNRRLRNAQSDARKRGEPIPESLFGEDDPTPDLQTIMARSARGRKAWENGERFETDCIKAAAAHGITLFKIPTGARMGKEGMYPVRTPFDYAGVVKVTARCIVFDAKSLTADDPHKGLRLGTGLVKPHQIAALETMGRSNAISGLVVQCGPIGEIRWLDWTFLRCGDAIPWTSDKWLSLSPMGALIDFSRLLSTI